MYLDTKLFQFLENKIVLIGYEIEGPAKVDSFSSKYWAGILKLTEYTNTVKLEPYMLTESFFKTNKEVADYLRSLDAWVVPSGMYFSSNLIFSITDVMDRKTTQIG